MGSQAVQSMLQLQHRTRSGSRDGEVRTPTSAPLCFKQCLTRYLSFCLEMVDLLIAHGVEPILVHRHTQSICTYCR
jgi:hypothetical protein